MYPHLGIFSASFHGGSVFSGSGVQDTNSSSLDRLEGVESAVFSHPLHVDDFPTEGIWSVCVGTGDVVGGPFNLFARSEGESISLSNVMIGQVRNLTRRAEIACQSASRFPALAATASSTLPEFLRLVRRLNEFLALITSLTVLLQNFYPSVWFKRVCQHIS